MRHLWLVYSGRVIVKGNPEQQISDVENVEIVFKDGVGYDSAKLIESVKGTVGLH